MYETSLDFNKIYTEFHPKIQRYLTTLVGESEAEDLTQEVFIRVNRALPGFRGESQLSTWIYRIATNAALDQLRGPAAKRSLEMELPEDADTVEAELADRDAWSGEEPPSTEEQLFRLQRVECFCDFVENLPANYRAIVALSELGEYGAAEIARLLGLNVEVVKIRLHRGRARLIQELRNHCKPEDWL